MIIRIKKLIICFSLFGFIFPDFINIPEVVTKVGTCSANWLKIESGIRGIGMGGAHVAAGDGIYASNYNPASIGFVNGSDVYFSHSNYLAGIKHTSFGYAKQINQTDFIGFYVFSINSGDIERRTTINPNGLGEGGLGSYTYKTLSISQIYTKILTDRLKVGFSLKYFREGVSSPSLSSQGFAVDIGSNFDTGIYGMVLGMSVSNFGPDMQYHGAGLLTESSPGISPNDSLSQITNKFPIPLTFRLGIKNDIIGDESMFFNIPRSRLTLSVDGVNAMDNTVYVSMGCEYAYNESAFIRFGSHFGHDTANISLGAGVKSNQFTIDVAYRNQGPLLGTVHFGVAYGF